MQVQALTILTPSCDAGKLSPPSPLELSHWAENAAFIMLLCSEAFSTAHSPHNEFSVIWPAFKGPYKANTIHFTIFTPGAPSIIPPALTSLLHLQPPLLSCFLVGPPTVSLAWLAHSPSFIQILPIMKATFSPKVVSFSWIQSVCCHITH